jgi:ABC-type polar amino acid transport system ATPase subunit
MIDIRGLRKTFASRSVLAGLSAEVQRGAIVAIAGPSGCGKSTLLRCLNGLEWFDAGSIEVAGIRLGPGPHAAALDALRRRVGMVFQEYHLFPHLSALDNVTLAPRLAGKLSSSEAERLGRRWLERVGLGDRSASRPAELSGGQKQRVALARALAQGVQVLLLDEPTSALDRRTRAEVRRVLADVARGGDSDSALTLLVVTHDLDLASELADELWVLDEGVIAERGATAALIADPQSKAARELFERD